MERGRERGREGRREGGREGEREGEREGGREGRVLVCVYTLLIYFSKLLNVRYLTQYIHHFQLFFINNNNYYCLFMFLFN